MTDLQQTQQSTTQEEAAPKPVADKLHVIVRNRNKIIFDNDVRSISSRNDTGKFDVLPEHSNFISLITSPITVRTLDGLSQDISFKSGIIKVKDNAVHCYIDLLAPETR